jgi:hypothetical protein
MAKKHYLQRIDMPEQKLYLEGNTHLGRSKGVEDHKARDLPDIFNEAEVAVFIEDKKLRTSRNHALIREEDGLFRIYDLNSLNGTSVNHRAVDSLEGRLLKSGDKVSLGPDIKFEYRTEEVTEYGAMSPFYEGPENYALLVGCEGGNLKGVKNDVEGIKEVLEERGFKGNIDTLVNSWSQKFNIKRKLKKMKKKASDNSLSVFYFSGHGSRDGEICLGGNNKMSYDEIYEFLEETPGKKLAIFDCCYSGLALDSIPEHTCVITSAGRMQKAYEGGTMVVRDDFANWETFGHFTRELIKIIEGIPYNVRFDEELEQRLRDSRKLKRNGQSPQMEGTVIILQSRQG